MTAIAAHAANDRSLPRVTWRIGAAVCGIAFVPVFIAGIFLAMNAPSNDASDATWLSWYQDSGHQTGLLIGAYLLIVGALLFIAFAAGVHEYLHGAAEQSPVLYRFATAAAGVFAVLVMVGAVQLVGIAGNIAVGDVKAPQTADLLRQNIGFPFIFVAGGLTAAAFVAVVTTLARQAGIFPAWLSALSYALAVILLVSIIFLPMVALPVWVLITSVVLLRRSTDHS